MKIGTRKPNINKSISAKTFGQASRASRSVMPGYGQKGMGVIKDPKKATYNAIYNSATKSVFSTPKQQKTAKAKESTARLLDLYPYDKEMPLHLKIIITAINAGKIVLALACIAGVIYTIWLFIWLMFINR